MKKAIFSLYCFLTIGISHAQYNNDAWFKVIVSKPITKQWGLDAEFQNRRQNGWDNKNPLDKNLVLSSRLWVHYQKSQHLKFSLAPFAYYTNYKTIRTIADETANPTGEYRFSFAAELKYKIKVKIILFNRSALEYRFFDTPKPNFFRVRDRLTAKYVFSNKLKFSVFDELFVHLVKNKDYKSIEHNRLGGGMEYYILPKLKSELGYIYIVRLPFSQAKKSKEHIVFLNLGYEL
ncbi:MAG: DUF2490 domain-containing protein [Bacteroidetes bacterium]|nr:DUF2490 domain-containing protein [Bacteroidota bacterium]